MAGSRLGGAGDGDSRPWLEPVEVEQEPSGPRLGKPIFLALLALVILGAAVGAYSWWSGQGATEGHGELIPAPPGPYKVKPSDPGGMDVDGEGDTAFAASAGGEPQGKIDMSAVPEEPIVKAGPGTKPGGAASARGAGAIQLGAFSSEAAADTAWKGLAKRFAYLGPLTHSVVEVKAGDKSLYRLRASGPGAADICGRLQIAGEQCVALD
ncbi:MAG TPA: SPOR domain-containing protein [Allosphingosinicella sp.]|jgi:hypothetical protein